MIPKVIITFIFCFTFVLLGQNLNKRIGVFLAHSTGTNIWGPNSSNTSVPLEIVKYNNSHNFTGINEFTIVKEDWPTDPWSNEWVRWHHIFDGEDTAADIQPYIDNYGIIIIKSCFPSSGIGFWGSPEDTLEPDRKTIFNYKWHWRSFIKKMESYPDKFFVVWTNAPLTAKSTDDNEAYLSDQFCTWAKDTLAMGLDPVYGMFPKNVYVFDFFHKLAGKDGKLPLEYALDTSDSHPNSSATELVAPQLVQEIFDAAIQHESLLPVELIKFSVSVSNDKICLSWETATEINNFGFDIERKTINTANSGWENIGFVQGSGTSNVPLKYNFIDNNPYNGTTLYRLKQIDNDGSFEYSNIVSINNFSGLHYSLKQNYPNPFNPKTTIEYSIPINTHVKIDLYDILGTKLKNLKNEFQKAGHYKLDFTIEDFPTGVYIYRIETDSYKESKKLLYLK